jgi:hypothetical protein
VTARSAKSEFVTVTATQPYLWAWMLEATLANGRTLRPQGRGLSLGDEIRRILAYRHPVAMRKQFAGLSGINHEAHAPE